MRYAQPNNEDVVAYTSVKVDGCSDTTIGFQLLSEQPSVSKRRYCNKVLVHECISAPTDAPMELDKVELWASDDPCYNEIALFKSSEEIDADPDPIAPTIELQLNDDDLVIGILVHFTAEETCGQPIRSTYKLYGYLDDVRETIAQGNLYITPCCCEEE